MIKNLAVGFVLMALTSMAWAADEYGTLEEAQKMSEMAAALVNDQGRDAAFAAFNEKNSDYWFKDLYVFCMDMEGVMLFHPIRPELAGQSLLEFDRYGSFLFKDMIAVAQSSGSGWVDYNWPHPGTDEIRAKTSYVSKNNEGFFCGVGAYK
ncbi:cache domain-containing protein [Thiorhodospira sibirica]|uniref:cache domain-containing protein n=1 Tax=Thiorhodospira sibirica TaxID=154347 RepID=UPI00022C0B1E|nr:cache domain-containing protein [Thiorhodospira sibirica]